MEEEVRKARCLLLLNPNARILIPKKKSRNRPWRKLKKTIYLPELPVKESRGIPSTAGNQPILPPQVENVEIVEITEVPLEVPQMALEGVTAAREMDEEGKWAYDDFLSKVLDRASMVYPCPIHQSPMQELKTKDPTSVMVYLRCEDPNYPVFTNLQDYANYYYECREQGHRWYTLDRIREMTCECGETPSLALSRSEKNFHKMYLRCRENTCGLFAFWRFHPNKKTIKILSQC